GQKKGGWGGEFPTVPGYGGELAVSSINLGVLLNELRKGGGAEAASRQALALLEQLAVDFPAVPHYRQDLATSHHNLGNLLAGLGQRAEAGGAFRQAPAIREQMAARFPPAAPHPRGPDRDRPRDGPSLAGAGS